MTAPPEKDELMGSAEVERELGVPRSTIARWLASDKMPQPIQRVSATPLWLREDIERFIEERDEDDEG